MFVGTYFLLIEPQGCIRPTALHFAVSQVKRGWEGSPPRIAQEHQVRISAHGEVCGGLFAHKGGGEGAEVLLGAFRFGGFGLNPLPLLPMCFQAPPPWWLSGQYSVPPSMGGWVSARPILTKKALQKKPAPTSSARSRRRSSPTGPPFLSPPRPPGPAIRPTAPAASRVFETE